MAQVRGAWSDIHSRYDAFLAGNLHPDYPVDRHIMWTRCRGWVVYRGYSQEITADCLTRFSVYSASEVSWRFFVPAGMGKRIPLEARLRLKEGRNAEAVIQLRELPVSITLSGEEARRLKLLGEVSVVVRSADPSSQSVDAVVTPAGGR